MSRLSLIFFFISLTLSSTCLGATAVQKTQLFLPSVESSAIPVKRALRVRMKVMGVFSPRGFFNIAVRLYRLKGLYRYKFDLRDSLAILDFKPGVKVSSSTIKEVMIKAGYKPGPFKIEEIPIEKMKDNGRGWFKRPRVDSRWAFIRWFQLNF